MRRTGLAIVLTLGMMAGGCDSGDDESSPGEATHEASPTATAAPTPDTESQLRNLAEDALALDQRAELMDRNAGTAGFFDTLFVADSDIARPGTVGMPATFTIRFPEFDRRTDARRIVRLLKKHGFGLTYGYDWEDLADNRVQRSGDLRCQVRLEGRDARLSCVTFDFLDYVEYDVADELTSLFVDETDVRGINCWDLLYPIAEHSEPPFGAILETGICSTQSWLRVYVDDGDGWKLVARSRAADRIPPEVAEAMCQPDYRDAFARMDVCPAPPT